MLRRKKYGLVESIQDDQVQKSDSFLLEVDPTVRVQYSTPGQAGHKGEAVSKNILSRKPNWVSSEGAQMRWAGEAFKRGPIFNGNVL